MQSLYTRIDKTRALLQPTPVEPHERTAAGHDDKDLPLVCEGCNWNALLLAIALSLCLWTVGFLLIKRLTPYLIAWLEP